MIALDLSACGAKSIVRTLFLVVVIVGTCLVPSRSVGQSRFDQIRDGVDGGFNSPAPSQSRGRSEPRRFSDDDDESFLSSLITAIFFGDDDDDDDRRRNGRSVTQVAYEERTGNSTNLDDYERSLAGRESYFAHYPYADGLDGYVMDEQSVVARPQTGAIRLRTYYSTDFDDIEIWHVDSLIEWNGGWGIDGQVDYLLESRPGGFQDNLTLGDLNGTFRVWTQPRSLFRAGLGLNWLADHGDTDVGINSTMIWDWFPTDPMVISSQVDYGLVGDAITVHLQSTIGLSWEHVELFGGYNYRRIAGVDLAGPVFGIRGWW